MKLTALLLTLLPAICFAQQSEEFHVEQWCLPKQGKVEVTLPDRTRVDCITYAHAIEFDFGHKWAQAIGQALHYGMVTGLRPGIVLITDRPLYINRLRAILEHYNLPIDLFIMEPIQ